MAQNLSVHVQVIDKEPFRLPMTIPLYLTVEDLTTRVARDAGLEAFWPDGRRRSFYLRARGRLLRPEEKLQALNLVDNELLHLLPEPPAGGGIVERPARYPVEPTRPAWRNALGTGFAALGLLAFAVADGLAVSVAQSAITPALGALGIGLLATGVARRALGAPGSAWRVVALAAGLALPIALAASLASLAADIPWGTRGVGWITALVGVVSGVALGWLAWHEPVERLPPLSPEAREAAVAAQTWPCAVCQLPVTAELKQDCAYGCGRPFHPGCRTASQALSNGRCTVCNEVPPT